MIPIIANSGGGKGLYIKEKIINSFLSGESAIYLNFRKSSSEFSEEFQRDSLIVNANSFTQISKIKDKPFSNLVFIDMTEKYTALSNKIKEKIIIEVLLNPEWINHTFFLDEAWSLPFSEKINELVRRRRKKVFFSCMDIKDLGDFYLSPSFTLFKNRGSHLLFNRFGLSCTDIDKIEHHFLSEDRFRYIEFRNGELAFKSLNIDIPSYPALNEQNSFNEQVEASFIDKYYHK